MAERPPKSVITFYRLPKLAREGSWETAWSVVVDDPASVSMAGIEYFKLAPAALATSAAAWISDPKNEFNHVVEGYTDLLANYMFVKPYNKAPIWGCPI